MVDDNPPTKTLRDEIMLAVLPFLYKRYIYDDTIKPEERKRVVAERAYELADEVLEVRDGK